VCTFSSRGVWLTWENRDKEVNSEEMDRTEGPSWEGTSAHSS